MDLFRLVTLHPALVHFAIGSIPVILLGYAVGWRRRSPGWTLVGDVALVVTALFTLLAAGFGLVSFLIVDWPGGLTLWKWLHLGLGALGAMLLVGFATYRVRARGPRSHSGAGSLVVAGVTSLVLLSAGWVGGEVLVFHSGIAVQAAGNGALSPPVRSSEIERVSPKNLRDAMGKLRSHWAAIQTELAEMIVHGEPSDEEFDRIAREARAMVAVAEWITAFDEREEERPGAGSDSVWAPFPVALAADRDPAAPADREFAQRIAAMGSVLDLQIQSVLEDAHARDLTKLSRSVGQVTGVCASCHAQYRDQRTK